MRILAIIVGLLAMFLAGAYGQQIVDDAHATKHQVVCTTKADRL